MLALAWAIARAEIRRKTVVGATCAYGAALVLIAVASRPTGSYPLLSQAVSSLVYLGPAFMAVGALLVARAAESGVGEELFLCGIGSRQRRRATAGAAVAVSLAVWLCGSVLATVVLAPWTWARHESLALVGQSGQGALWWAAIGLAAVVLLALVGTACGCLCRSRVAAFGLVALLSGTPLMLAAFGQFPPALWFRALLPGGALDSVFERRDDLRGNAGLRWGVPATYLLSAAFIVATGRRPSDPGAPQAVDHEDPSAAPTRSGRLALAAPVALLVAAAAVLGAVAPQRISSAIPWWLQGAWVEDLARDRASEPVVRSYLAAVRAGDAQRERRLVLGKRDEVLDPVLREQIRRARRVFRVRYAYREDVAPGTVSAELGEDAGVTLCSARTRTGWRVVRVSSVGVCE